MAWKKQNLSSWWIEDSYMINLL